MRETTQAAPGKTSPHSAKGRLGDEGGFLLVAAADEFEQQVGVAMGVGEVAHLVD